METTEISKTILHSPSLGEIQYNEDQVIIFPAGLVGFEELTTFVFYENDDLKPLICLVSIEEPAIYFPLLDPKIVDINYGSENLSAEIKGLGINKLEDARLYSIVTIGNELAKVTINLRGPLVVNSKRMLGEQIILINSNYLVKHPLQLLNN